MRTPSQIADVVLTKIAESSESEWNVPQMMALGGGVGLGGGVLGAGIMRQGDIRNLLQLHYQRPRLEASRESVEALLKTVKKQNPKLKKLSPRALTKALAANPAKIGPENYYTARRGYEEGFSGLSRNRKLTQLLKRRVMRSGLLGAGLGLGSGVGAGLLAAIGSGKFDNSES